ncbi:MAG TPA: iron-sulfur cluster-binding domain-containing protein [Clostridia bacterium]|nr:iron-sulfur cluster-binding domain-containing protein [Clostridia bacterium]
MSSDKVVIRSNFNDLKSFARLVKIRKDAIENTPVSPLIKTHTVNDVAKMLHPEKLFLKVKRVVPMDGGVKSFVLTNDFNKGTQSLPYFISGQHISVRLAIGKAFATRSYTIVSSPRLALTDNEYIITVKPTQNGFASSFILNRWHKGSAIEATAPSGNFYYNPLRDKKDVLGIAGDIGITPFISLAQAIDDGTENANLTLIYGCRKLSDAIFKPLLDDLSERNPNIKVAYVFSDEKVEKCERGFITRAIVQKYAPESYSLFMSGPPSLYKAVAAELSLISVERKDIRLAPIYGRRNPDLLVDYPEKAKDKEFYMTVYKRNDIIAEIKCFSYETLLNALERNGIKTFNICRGGECDCCRSRLTAGEVFVPKATDKRRGVDPKYNIINLCSTYPISDVAIELF